MLKKFQKNLIYAFLAQFISMTMSVLISLILPKLLGVEEFAYWQMFVLYSSYVGLFHFGLSDGLYLRYGGTGLADMDKSLIGSQFRLMVIWQTVISIILLAAVPLFVGEPSRRFVFAMTAVYLVLANATWCMGFLFQAANETRIYSKSVILSKLLVVLYIVASLFADTHSFRQYVGFYVIAQGAAAVYCLYLGRAFLTAKWIPVKKLVAEICTNAAIGIHLTVANIAGSLTLGIGKIFVDHRWGLSAFGILSLSISLVNFALQFISQASMVLFPQLRQTDDVNRNRLYHTLDGTLGIVLCGVLMLYVPCRWLLMHWLPEYADGLSYLGILLPICVLDGKMQLLYSTYLKVLRRERELLRINLLCCGLCFALCVLFSQVSDQVVSVAYAMLAAIAVRNILSGQVLARIMQQGWCQTGIPELLLCGWFVLLNQSCSSRTAMLLYAGGYLLVCVKNRKQLSAMTGKSGL